MAAWVSVALGGCGGSTQAAYLRDGDSAFAERQTRDADGDSSLSLGDAHFNAELCRGFDLTPKYDPIDAGELEDFLRKQGYQVELTSARPDLVYLDVSGNGEQKVRLRVAILEDRAHAGRDLHEAILQHGPGSWGVHRSNLAVLAPIGSMTQVVTFAGRSRLACWGELMMAGRDDTFVVAGGYREP